MCAILLKKKRAVVFLATACFLFSPKSETAKKIQTVPCQEKKKQRGKKEKAKVKQKCLCHISSAQKNKAACSTCKKGISKRPVKNVDRHRIFPHFDQKGGKGRRQLSRPSFQEEHDKMIKKTSNTQRKGNESDSQEHSICLKERQYRFSLYSIAPGPVKHTGIRIDMRKKEEEGNREYPSQKARKFRDFLKRKMTFSAYHSKVKEGAETQKSVKGKKILHLMPKR